ncbi:MAG: hypothetical protein L6R40_004989 [Gallowayella cf. fulva]|nr:MAG: hypothetical protein L6R40_004989 [Xanthomendoza cf. fulva]
MEGPPPGTDLSASQVPRILGVNIATMCLAVFAVALRFAARRLTHAALWWDDWLMLPAIIFSALLCIVPVTYMVDNGFGRHIWVLPTDAGVVWAKGLFISELSYTIIICSIKFSLLAFYWRIFKQSKIRIPIYILGATVSFWGIAVILVAILQWPFHCGVNVNQFFNGNSIPNIVTDAALLVLPMPFIWKLHLPKAQKIGLTSVFILGIFVIGVSIARFTFIIDLDLASPDITWNSVDVQIWTGVECYVACLPSLRPLLDLVLFGSIDRSHRRSPPNRKPSGGPSARSYHFWDPLSESYQVRRGRNADEIVDVERDLGFTRLEDGEVKKGTYISATSVALDDINLDQGIQVRTDVYFVGHGER